MKQYIDKDAVLAMIKQLKDEAIDMKDRARWFLAAALARRIEAIEVKEVDLEKYYHEFLQKEWFGNPHVRTVSEMMAFTAKHFFELGIKSQKGEL